MSQKTKYIFITGGVISSLGKGVTTAVIASLLKSRGYKVTCIKCDAYVNIDAGTMNPTEHGEVFVTADGLECDQDLGNYERFLNEDFNRTNYVTTGQIYQEVIKKERNFEYAGEDVEVVPHIPEELIRRIKLAAQNHQAEIILIEIGGTVGEYQNILFLEADRMLKRDYPKDVVNIHISYLPIPKTVGEMKTKPVQYSVRTLNSAGIQPEFVVGRAELPLDDKRKEKISVFCSIKRENVISNPDVKSIYELPLIFEEQKLTAKILKELNLPAKKQIKTKILKDNVETDYNLSLQKWQNLIHTMKTVKTIVKVVIVGKYFETGDFTLEDSYISVIEAIKHATWYLKLKPEIVWIDSQDFEDNQNNDSLNLRNRFQKDKKSHYSSNRQLKKLNYFDAVIVPGGFGTRGVQGKIKAIEYVRHNKIPYLGLCYGLQLACVEFARNVLKIKDAQTEEINPRAQNLIIHILPEQKELLKNKQYGATMRLGNYDCIIESGSKVYELYKKYSSGLEISNRSKTIIVQERHRHRYEFNNRYCSQFEKNGFKIVGRGGPLRPPENIGESAYSSLVEIMELTEHPYFVGSQFHPEFKSRPFKPHPLFIGLIKAAAVSQS